jgi:preprotein translocase subunit SecE
MSKEGDVAAGSLGRSMLSMERYKPSQGRYARQGTFIALALTIILGVWSLHRYLDGMRIELRYVIDAALIVGGLWACYRLINMPRFADFLIQVEIEMTKVSWPTRTDLVRTSGVVMVTIFGLATVLFLYDIVWQRLLSFVGVIG